MAYHEPLDYALVVGIDDYPVYGKNGRNLNGAIRDAKRFTDWLKNTEIGGGLPEGNCKLVTSEDDPLAMGKTAIDRQMKAIWNEADDNGGGRRLYLFFSGHGQILDDVSSVAYRQSLCLPNWSHRMPNEAIITDSYHQCAQKCMPFKEIVVFLDCCRVPAIKVRADNTSIDCGQHQDGHELINTLVFFASEPMRKAFEGAEPTGEKDEPIVHGYFTSALIDALKRGSNRPGGGISAFELWNELEYWVPTLAKDDGHTQNPRCFPLIPPEDVVFGKAKLELGNAGPVEEGQSNFEIRFQDYRQANIQLLNTQTEVVKEGDPSTGPWPVRLDPERYMLIDTGTNDQYSFHFRPEMKGAHVIF